MSSPPPYVIFQDYNAYQTTHQLPGPALQGVDLNTEFNRLKATTDALINNLNLLQRSDGALNNQLVTPDTISSALAILIANWAIKGVWVTATAYALKDYVTNGGNGYVCIVAHTAGTFATDLAAGKWSLVSTIGATGPQGVQGNQGIQGPPGPVAPTFRNRIINGDFRIDQRNNGVFYNAGPTSPVYTIDRWQADCTDTFAGSITVQRVTGTGSNQFAARLSTVGSTNLTTTFRQKIESRNCYDLLNQNVVVSVMISASLLATVTWAAYRPNSQDNWSGRTQIATGTITINSTPTNYNFTFNAGSGVTSGLAIEFTTGPLSLLTTLQYENVQLELGTVPSAFEKRPMATELTLCQRHCLVRSGSAGFVAISGCNFSTTVRDFADRFPVEMFKAPTFSVSASTDFSIRVSGSTSVATALTATADKWGALVQDTGSFTAGVPGTLIMNNANALMTYAAEL